MSEEPASSGIRTVFVVEDDPESLRGMADAIVAEGYTVKAFSDFDDAHRNLLQTLPDALLLDIRLGPFNGLHLAVIARQRSPTMRILVFSGFVDPVLIAEVESLRARFMAKPLDYDDVLEYLRG